MDARLRWAGVHNKKLSYRKQIARKLGTRTPGHL